MRCNLIQRNDQTSVRRGNRTRIVPFVVVRSPIMQIHRSPKWIVTRVEASAITVKFVAENQIHFAVSSVEGVSSFDIVGVSGSTRLRPILRSAT